MPLPQQGSARSQRRRRLDNRRQHAVVDSDQLGGVAGDVARFGDDKGDRVADMAHAAGGERRARRHDHRLDARHLGDARQRADALGRQVGGGEDAADAGERARRRGIDRRDLRMAVRRAQHDAVELARRVDVLDEAAPAAQEARVLEAAHRAPDLSVGNGHGRI